MIESKIYTCKPKKAVILNGTYDMNVIANGLDLNLVLNGVEIHKEYKIGKNTLLITYYDHFDGVIYWFNLLSETSKVLDVVSTPEYFGFLQNTEYVSDDTIAFGFHGTDDKWKIKCSEKATWCFSISEVFKRPIRHMLSKRYLWLQKQ